MKTHAALELVEEATCAHVLSRKGVSDVGNEIVAGLEVPSFKSTCVVKDGSDVSEQGLPSRVLSPVGRSLGSTRFSLHSAALGPHKNSGAVATELFFNTHLPQPL
jgi:hypothetical protein